MKKSIVFYDSWATMIKNMPVDAAGELIKMICMYSFEGEEIQTENNLIKAMFEMIKTKLDEDATAYDEAIKRRSDAGKKGMQKRWSDNKAITNDNNVITSDNNVIRDITKDNTDKQKITNITDTVSVSVSDTVSVFKKRERRFTPPTLTEVTEYCNERNNGVDPERFVDFYASKGWKVGNQPMKDWKACVRTWEKRDRASPKEEKGKFDDIAARLISESMGDVYV